jgi:signal transduction histidine kinase/ligand-binding sensor domain-containing protein
MSLKRGLPTKECLATVLAHGLFLLTWHCAPVNAQQLSIRHYDVGNGLAHSQVTSIFQDRKGYLWFGTFEGLSRFDGYGFTNYSTADGLGHLIISAVAEDRQGHLCVGTLGGGVACLLDDPQDNPSLQGNAPRPTTRTKFLSFQVNNSGNHVSEMLLDKDDSIWCIADGSIYHGVADRDGKLKFTLVVGQMSGSHSAAFADRQGHLWFGGGRELVEIIDGQVIKHKLGGSLGTPAALNTIPRPSDPEITAIAEDHEGRLFITNRRELFEFIAPTTDGKGREQWRKLPLTLAAGDEIFSMIGDAIEGLWIGTQKGLIRYTHGGQTSIAKAQALSGGRINALAHDREGNLWIGTEANGALKLSKEVIVSYTTAEGLPDQDVGQIFEDREGRVYALTNSDGLLEIVAGRAVPVPGTQSPPFNTIRVLLDSRDDWWVWPGGSNNLFRFHGLKPQFKNGEEITVDRGNQVSHWGPVPAIYEDPAGKVWISGIQGRGSLYRFDPTAKGSSAFEPISIAEELGKFAAEQSRRRGERANDSEVFAVARMISDTSGALWFGTYGELGRFANGKLDLFEPTDGLPETRVRALFVDSQGSLWIGLRYGGVSMTKNPTADHPTFVNFSTRTGLASDSVQSVTEDNFGRIYIGTGRGLDQLDPATGRIRHFTTADGLAGTWVRYCMKDSGGNIWIATMTGLSRLNPQAERANSPPPVYLSRIHIAGEDLLLPETGAVKLPELELAASRNNLLIEYVGLSFAGEGALQYQYQLEGVDPDWSAPTEQRSVNYARLAPGLYRFKVRAIAPSGSASVTPAVIQFRILPPIWQRWWFLLLALTAAALAGYVFYRYRVTQLLELERVRTRIATDLHDDIGSNLSRIAILSEVVSHQVKHDGPQVREPLAKIAGTSRELVDSMSDIVWAINPAKDQLSDLTQRMRRFASDILTARNIEFRFRAPSVEEYLKVGADIRRQVFLIFKEAVNNLVRHSACTRVDLELRIDGRHLLLTLKDNGKGFDPALLAEGHGLMSMRARAESINGRFEISSGNGDGTTVSLIAPLLAAPRRVEGRRRR